jgi:predicted component of type VI protein secretion system
LSRKLIVNDGRRERELLLVGKIVVGRDPMCDVSEADSLLSRRHAEFSIENNTIVVRDLGSRNGIYVNGARTAEGRLRSGDRIRIGNLELKYVEDAAPIVVAPELADVDATAVIPPAAVAAAAAPTEPQAATPPPAAAKPSEPEEDPDRTSFVAPPAAKPAAAFAAKPVSRPGSAQPPAASVAPPGTPRPSVPPAAPVEDADQTSLVAAPSKFTPRPGARRPAPSRAASASVAAPATPAPPPRPAAVSDDGEQTRIVAAPKAPNAPADSRREARALSIAVEAIAEFLGRTSAGARATEAVNALEQDLALAAEGRLDALQSPAGPTSAKTIVDELNRLMARLQTASSDLI